MVTSFERYKKGKSIIANINFTNKFSHMGSADSISKMAAPSLARLSWSKRKIYTTIKLLLRVPVFSNKNRTFDNLVTYSFVQRDDHYKKIKKFIELEKLDQDECVFLGSKRPNSIKDSVLIFTSLYQALDICFRNAIFDTDIIVSLTNVIKSHEYYTKLNLEVNNYIAYNSADMDEAVLSNIFNKQVPTYGLQHGVMYKYNNVVPMDVINYENFSASNAILWGNYTCREIKEFLPIGCNIITKYHFGESFSFTRQRINKILILLPRKQYINNCIELLNLVSTFDTEYFLIRCHPSLDGNKYLSSIVFNSRNMEFSSDSTNDLMSQFLFRSCISFNSTSLFESIYFRQNTIQYISGNDEFVVEELENFRSEKELEDCLQKEEKHIDKSEYFNEEVIIRLFGGGDEFN